MTKKTLQKLLDNLHASYCPSYSSTFASHLTAITESFCARCENLMFANRLQIIGSIICWEPSFSPFCDWSFKDLILYLLKIEYSADLVNCLIHTKEFHSSLARRNSRAPQIKLSIEMDLNMKKKILSIGQQYITVLQHIELALYGDCLTFVYGVHIFSMAPIQKLSLWMALKVCIMICTWNF